MWSLQWAQWILKLPDAYFFPVHECPFGIGIWQLAELPHLSPGVAVRLWMSRKSKGKLLP